MATAARTRAAPAPRRAGAKPARARRAKDDERDVVYFADLAAWRAWLAKHHDRQDAQWVGFHKRGTGTPSITWPESVEGALAFGWIDGVRKSIDDARYKIRFSKRKPTSIWSAINIATMKRLITDGLAHDAGIAAFEKRSDARSAVYSYEREAAELSPEQRRAFKKNARAWAWFEQQAPWYRRACAHWVTSAKKDETRARRLAQLMASSAAQRPVPPLARPTATKAAR